MSNDMNTSDNFISDEEILSEFKTVDAWVGEWIIMNTSDSMENKVWQSCHDIVDLYPKTLLKLLKCVTNKPSTYDLLIIKYAIYRLSKINRPKHRDKCTLEEILQFYKYRKV